MARESEYVRRENRKRTLTSWGSALLIYLILISGYWAWEHFVRKDISMSQGPVLIRLGEPEGADVPQPVPPRETPEETPPEPEETQPQTEPEPEIAPVEQPAVEPTLPAEKVTPDTPEPTPSEKPAVKTAPPAPPEPIRGSDKGNNYELNSEGGEIGRSLWVPIAQYMPLPRTIEKIITADGGLESLLNSVQPDAFDLYTAEQNRTLLLKYYDKKAGGVLELSRPVPMMERPDLWAILERAGYDMRSPEYKTTRTLLPVTINFSVIPSGSTVANKLDNLELVRSSGYEDIDEAVLFAFEQSSYYSKTDEPIKGRFTYRFSY